MTQRLFFVLDTICLAFTQAYVATAIKRCVLLDLEMVFSLIPALKNAHQSLIEADNNAPIDYHLEGLDILVDGCDEAYRPYLKAFVLNTALSYQSLVAMIHIGKSHFAGTIREKATPVGLPALSAAGLTCIMRYLAGAADMEWILDI